MMKALLICVAALLAFYSDLYSQEDGFNIVEDKSEISPGDNPDNVIRKNFFLRAEVSKTECYVGEPLMAVFKAYSRLDANSQVLKRPSLSGFSVIEMVDAYNNQPEIERYNGDNYYVHLIRKVQLFPLQAGTFTIEPAEVESVIHLRKSGSRRFRDFFRRHQNNGALDKQMVFRTSPVTIHVNALPAQEQPDDFAGAVGDFLVQMQMEDSVIAAREPALVKLIVSGVGNFPLITEPKVIWPSSAEISTPTIQEQVNKYAYPLSGMKSYQFTIEHRDTGHFSIPPVKFSYFDPKTKMYKIAESNMLTYAVVPAAARTGRKKEPIVFSNEKQMPLQYYYFGAIALFIVGLIIYFMVRPPKKDT